MPAWVNLPNLLTLSRVFLVPVVVYFIVVGRYTLAAIIFGRDIYILAAVAVVMLFTPIRGFPPSIWGKVSTFVQICTAVLWMARTIFATKVLDELSSAMLWPCVAFTVWSGLDYTWKGILAYRKY